MSRSALRWLTFALSLFVVAPRLPSAAQGPAARSVVIYAGRSQSLVEPVIKQFERETGIRAKVRYASDPQLIATLQEEGGRSPADVYWANSSSALVAAAKAGLLARLPEATAAIPRYFVPRNRLWVPVTVRFRVLAYNPQRVRPGDLPSSVMALPSDARWKGRIGWAPAYASNLDFLTAMRLIHGEALTREWLQAMKALEPGAYAANSAMVDTVRSGEIDIAMTNHYYIQRFIKAGFRIGTHYFAPGDVGGLGLVTGAGLLKTSANSAPASRLLRYLLSAPAQQFFVSDVFEYPVLASGVIMPPTLLTVSDAMRRSPRLDFDRLTDLDGTLKLMRDLGVL
ncbi:MAG: iron ABC transporter substrate-binding protein [Armatimonadetes bacterium]|nr:iron ABC transporter substrate-binding protein [Armatimonadota bacterium]